MEMAVIMIRLDKYLADMGVGTRAEVKKYIRQGKVKVDGLVVKSPEEKVDVENQEVSYLDQPVGYQSFEYYMLNKPAGVISATTDTKDKTVIDLITDKKRKDLFPVGRLDKDTEGLLLITNDGELAHRLLSPKKHVDKVYYAKVDGVLNEQDVAALAQGITLGDGLECLPADLEPLGAGDECLITLREGKYHQVKRMLASREKPVLYLKRLSMGGLKLDESLEKGQWRPLTTEELKALREKQSK